MRVTLKLSPKIALFKMRVQQANNKCLEQLQHKTIFLPPFVDTNDQSTDSMLTGDSSKINCDWSMVTSPIDSENLNKSVVTSPIDLENSNLSKEKGSQNGSQSDLFDPEKGSENDKNNKRPKK